uniref:SET domain-containing protein n=1 Tax=Timema bartmani TaxID=61472 RepID=A0A7R9ERP8_9NEOP|nr:unnamed protein product [Timema bartmani]
MKMSSENFIQHIGCKKGSDRKKYFVGHSIVVRATRPLGSGDIVAENYGPVFTKRSLDSRQRALSSRYWFRCICQACKENWPALDMVDNNDFRLWYECPTPGCKKLLAMPGNKSNRSSAKQGVKCPACKKHVRHDEALATLVNCQAWFKEGVEAMEVGDVDVAIRLFCSYLNSMHSVGFPPHKDILLCQEALRICMADIILSVKREDQFCEPDKVVMGTICQNNPVFDESVRITQCTSNCIVALCTVYLTPPSSWSSTDIDSILLKGNEVQISSLSNLRSKFGSLPPVYLAADEVVTSISLQSSLSHVSCELEPFQGISAQSFSDEIVRFLVSFDNGVLTANNLSVALFKEDSQYWVFDSQER